MTGKSQAEKPQRHIAAGIVSGLVGCSCGLIPLALILVGSISTAAALDSLIMSVEPYIIVVSAIILAGMIVLNLRLQKCCNMKGLLSQKKFILSAVIIYIVFLVVFLYVIKPYTMAQIDRFGM